MERNEQLEKAAGHYKAFCEILGIDLTRPDTVGTPDRVARMMLDDFTVGLRAPDFKFTTFPAEGADQLVVVAGIRVVSVCAHHHLPFFGTCHVCYLPKEKLAGLSKLPRAVQHVARQPTMQEVVVNKIVELLAEKLEPRFIGVSMVAEHTCMSCRGVNEHDSLTITNRFWANPTERSKTYPTKILTVEDFETTKQEFFRAVDEWYKAKARG